MIDDEDHGSVGIDRLHCLLVEIAKAHAVKERRERACQPNPDPEIRIGRKRGHDLLRVAARLRLRGLAWNLVFSRVRLDRAQYFGIEDKLIDQRLAFRQLERLDAELE